MHLLRTNLVAQIASAMADQKSLERKCDTCRTRIQELRESVEANAAKRDALKERKTNMETQVCDMAM